MYVCCFYVKVVSTIGLHLKKNFDACAKWGKIQEFPWPQLITNLHYNSGNFNKIEVYIENYCVWKNACMCSLPN